MLNSICISTPRPRKYTITSHNTLFLSNVILGVSEYVDLKNGHCPFFTQNFHNCHGRQVPCFLRISKMYTDTMHVYPSSNNFFNIFPPILDSQIRNGHYRFYQRDPLCGDCSCFWTTNTAVNVFPASEMRQVLNCEQIEWVDCKKNRFFSLQNFAGRTDYITQPFGKRGWPEAADRLCCILRSYTTPNHDVHLGAPPALVAARCRRYLWSSSDKADSWKDLVSRYNKDTHETNEATSDAVKENTTGHWASSRRLWLIADVARIGGWRDTATDIGKGKSTTPQSRGIAVVLGAENTHTHTHTHTRHTHTHAHTHTHTHARIHEHTHIFTRRTTSVLMAQWANHSSHTHRTYHSH